MNTKSLFLRLTAILGVAVMATSCTTAYDYYGRPVQTVDPAVAVAGVAAAGVLGYAIGRDSGHGYGGGYRGRGGHGRGCRY